MGEKLRLFFSPIQNKILQNSVLDRHECLFYDYTWRDVERAIYLMAVKHLPLSISFSPLLAVEYLILYK